MAESTDPLYTLREVAQLLNISRSKAWLLTRSGSLPAIRIGRQYRYRRSAVESYLDANSTSATTCAAAAQ
jgi:putative molybdopterin biosynthesis protein